MAIDPVCKMMVDEKKPAATSEYKGQKYYFCAVGCKKAFDKDPEKFLAKKEYMPSIRDYLTNMSVPMPLHRKIRLVVRNNWIRLTKRQGCCGHHGEPGC
jgi:YHS domain-containing protein